MTLETWGLVATVILGLDIWAIASVIGARRPAAVKLTWCAAILALPVLGFLAWLVAGPRTPRPDF